MCDTENLLHENYVKVWDLLFREGDIGGRENCNAEWNNSTKTAPAVCMAQKNDKNSIPKNIPHKREN